MEFWQCELVTDYLWFFLSFELNSAQFRCVHPINGCIVVEMKENYSKLNANDILTSLLISTNEALRSAHQQTNWSSGFSWPSSLLFQLTFQVIEVLVVITDMYDVRSPTVLCITHN